MRVKHFRYDGFMGRLTGGYADYTAEFKGWTEDPGICLCVCSDGEERCIPTYALEGFNASDFPKQNNEGKVGYIGPSCHS